MSFSDSTIQAAGRGRAPGLAALVVVVGSMTVTLGLAMMAMLLSESGLGLSAGSAGTGTGADTISAAARADIPPAYLDLYQRAARHYGLDWAILAGIGKLECDHGRDRDPSCWREGAVNSAGAGGPAQFLASTWSIYGVDGDGDGTADRWDRADAIFSMASYLRRSGAPRDYRTAIYAYNHAEWYVDEVERWAASYRGPPRVSTDEVTARGLALNDTVAASAAPVPGDRAVLSRADGHQALVPAGAPPVVQAMVIAGNELQSLPYGPAGHPDPRGAPSEDCSSTLNYVLYRAGVRSITEIVRDNPLAQSYVRWGSPGPGRWVTVYSTIRPTAHVFVVIAGLRLDTSHHGTDTGPNRDQDGPRWRILDHIPTWAHWSVRHPPGL